MRQKTIDMYQNPETGVYEAKQKKIVVIVGPIEETRKVVEEIERQKHLEGMAVVCLMAESMPRVAPTEKLSEIISTISELIPFYRGYENIVQRFNPFVYPSEKDYRSKKYSTRKESMSREHKHNAYRASGSWQRSCSNQQAKYFARGR